MRFSLKYLFLITMAS